ncbi:MAG: hypothetical protein ACRDK5_01105 [Solirubrobacterales bacterium]
MRARRLTIVPLAALLALALGMPSASRAAAKKSANAACGPQLDTLYPTAPQADRFTMVIRINKFNDIETYANSDEATGGLRPRLRDRDIFLINTRFQDTEAANERKIATELRRQFPCNRIVALNGLSFDPNNTTGYMFSLTEAPEVSAVLLDWEQIDWNTARSTDPGLPRWEDAFNPMLKRLKGRLAALANWINAAGSGQQLGIVPFARADWNLGLMARTIDRQSARVVAGRHGLQSSQTQKSCQTGAGAGMRTSVKSLFTQYKRANFKKIKPKRKGAKPTFKRLEPKTQKLNLGVQISFTSTPVSTSPDPVKSVGPAQAADCTVNAIFQKAGAILYWARPQDMDALFADPRICALRPSQVGIC